MNLKGLTCILVCIVIVSLFTYGYWLSPALLLSNENISHLYGHAPNSSKIYTMTDPSDEYDSNCNLCMSIQLLPLTAVQNCFYMFKTTAVVPIVQICRKRHWRWRVAKDSEMIIFKMKKLSYNNSLFILHETPTVFYHSFIRKMTTSKRQLVASISKSHKVFSTKMAQLMYSRRLVTSFGCSLNQLKFIPKSFLASEESDCFDFFSYATEHLKTKWILKPYNGVCGYGIEFFQDTPSMVKRLSHKCGAKANWRENQYIIQEYLPNLLLLNGRKFDIRAFILIARTSPYFLYYHPGYLRVAVAKLANATGREAQLTNTHVQGSIEGFSPEEHFWTFNRLQQYISNTSSGNDDFVQAKLEPFIKQTGLFWLQAGMRTFERLPATYLLLGLDFMVTSDYHVWFIEVNHTPLWPKQVPFIYSMGSDMIDLVIEIHSSPNKFANSQPGDKYGSWELVYNELLAHNLSYQYNPCKDFPIQS